MPRVKRNAIKSFKIEGRTYSTAYTAAKAFADALAFHVDCARYDRIDEDDETALDRYYDSLDDDLDRIQEKAYRRCLPIFQRYFQQDEEKY